jgi:O-methyltransferase
MNAVIPQQEGLDRRYLDLMKQCLTRYLFIDEEFRPLEPSGPGLRRLAAPALRALRRRGLRVGYLGGERSARRVGRDWPAHAETMAGLERLDNVEKCVADVVNEGVPGDLIEAGVWRGGTSIFMRAVLAALGETTRRVWVADSFRGLPSPDAERYPADAGLDLTTPALAVGLEEVKANFARYGLLDDQVEFLVGWFKDTLPSAPIDRLAVIRLDGDLYESTMDGLTALYPKLSVGGYVIVDDYGCIEACRRGVDDFRAENGITEALETVDWTARYWRRLR